MVRSFRPIKAKEDTYRLKEQRDVKKIKDKLALKYQAEKASEDYIELLFLWNLYKECKYWYTKVQVNIELDMLSGITSRRSILKE